MGFLSFDIEIADVFDLKPGESLDDYAPFSISVAAAVASDGGKRLWYSKNDDGSPKIQMDETDARDMLSYLERMQAENTPVFAWNGLHFDLRWLGHNAGQTGRAALIALASYDPMFQFFNRRGFPVSLAAVADGMGIGQSKLMDSADAPKEWQAGNHERVMEYVVGDCQMTNRIVEAITGRRFLRWRTKKGTYSSEPLPQLKTVAEVLRDPEPDQSWMRGPGLRRSDFTDWMPGGLLPR